MRGNSMRISWKKLTALVAGAALVALAGIAVGNVPNDEYETIDKKNLLLTAHTGIEDDEFDADVHAQCVAASAVDATDGSRIEVTSVDGRRCHALRL